jgi:hypothetical protein
MGDARHEERLDGERVAEERRDGSGDPHIEPAHRRVVAADEAEHATIPKVHDAIQADGELVHRPAGGRKATATVDGEVTGELCNGDRLARSEVEGRLSLPVPPPGTSTAGEPQVADVIAGVGRDVTICRPGPRPDPVGERTGAQ